MASIAFPELAKTADLSDGTTYGYVAVPPSDASKPTFLFLHGYPSSSYDWRHQIKSLPASGFGVIVPDLLGFGDTDAPEDVAAYRMKTMAHHMEELLSLEEVSRCIAVGHDWGSGLLSRLITYMPEKLSGAIFISVGYLEPGLVWDIEAFIKVSRETFGYETYGYWLWHNTDQAAKDCNDHPASVFSLLYPADPDDWKKYFAPVEKAAAFVRAGRLGPLPTWFDLTEYTIRDRILAKKGYQGPLNWYKAAMRGVNIPDESVLPDEARYCGVPTLFVAASQDFVTRADAQGANTRKWARDLRVKELDCGHWVQLEKPEELHSSLVEFAQQIAA
ncbi:epoxide hydrolase, putative [Beauveria bassiana ARSEF 2860]|uniref:Epoxide hydrolase, putative n=1 Tax=Beauveria bassiana (strain ARSEF 2860) TaxID=655819 RepID=J4UML6_BEAB2|nr:epoxide hydrolase, putative [Beauveria bassiana ARSEF 2860]EJP66152.1 epoxide hydrolase, putative [Beauveria bassiana ARSEF 2860]